MTEKAPLLLSAVAPRGTHTNNEYQAFLPTPGWERPIRTREWGKVGEDLELGLRANQFGTTRNGVNPFDALPDELLLYILSGLTFREKLALQTTERRWRQVARGDHDFSSEHAKRLEKARWYHGLRAKAQRDREAKSKQRKEEWEKKREEQLEMGLITPEEYYTPEQLAKRKRLAKWVLFAFICLLILYGIGMGVGLAPNN